MPRTRRSRVLDAAPEDVWAVVADPHHLPRWWPRVTRVEGVEGDSFTQVMTTDRGRPVRADFRVSEREDLRAVRWEQVVEGTPFDRILRAAATEVSTEPVGEGTRVTVELDRRLRGLSRFGGFMMRYAARRQLDEALDALAGLVGRRRA